MLLKQLLYAVEVVVRLLERLFGDPDDYNSDK